MKDHLEEGDESNSFHQIKKQLQKHFGEEIIISEIDGKKNSWFSKEWRHPFPEFFHQAQKDGIDKAAAELIKSDIKSVVESNDVYPTSLEMSSVANFL